MPNIKMQFNIIGIGAWGPGFNNWRDLSLLLSSNESLNGNETGVEQAASPRPEIIPANERRRAPLPVKLAVEAAWQASQAAGIDPKDLACVFASGLGDTDITDYMCKMLNTETMQLSPTKFHNSVHNAAAGYWTISTRCMQAASSIAGFDETASLALLEGVSQCVFENRPLLITLFDAPAADIMKDLLKNIFPFAVAMIIVPKDSSVPAPGSCLFELEVSDQPADWNPLFNPALTALYQNNPAARILALLECMAKNETGKTLKLPLSASTSITLRALTT